MVIQGQKNKIAENFGAWGRTVLKTKKILCRHYVTTSTKDTETPPYKEQHIEHRSSNCNA